MEHASQQVDLVDENGSVVGAKPRRDIVKGVDLYHTVFTILITPDKQIVLSKIPVRSDLPNLYAGLLGCTVATIRRHGESPEEASSRSLNNELNLKDVTTLKLGEGFEMLGDGQRVCMSVYYSMHSEPNDVSHTDIESVRSFTRQELVQALEDHRNVFTPSFLRVWEKYGKDLEL
jgi:hypothetical protein